MFVFLLANFTQHDTFQFQPGWNKFHDCIIPCSFRIFHCVYIPHLHNPLICSWTPGLIPYLRYCLSAEMKNGGHKSFWVKILSPQCVIVSSYGSSSLFIEDVLCQFPQGWTRIHAHQWCTRVPLSLHPCQHRLFLSFLKCFALIDVRWSHCFHMGFPNDKWCWVSFFLCLLIIYLSSSETCLFTSLPVFWEGFIFVWLPL